MTEQNKKNEEAQEISGSEEFIYEENEEMQKLGNDVQKLRKRLKECFSEKEKYLTGWQRAQADFVNYKRRQEEQAAEWPRIYSEGVIRDILPVLDSLDAAIATQPSDQGLLTLKSQLRSVLKKHGLEEMKSINEKFNPEIHEVVECENGENEHGGEIVSGEIQKGYLLNGKLLRAAKVRVKK